MERPWRIIHIAGHGEPPIDDRNARAIRAASCCPAARSSGHGKSARCASSPSSCSSIAAISRPTTPNQLLKPTNYDRAQFASGVAQALIKGGVRCVIAAGWAVDDEAASVFAATLLQRPARRRPLHRRRRTAREDDAHACGGNTWAAYQCYGDPDWRFRTQTGDAQRPTPPPARPRVRQHRVACRARSSRSSRSPSKANTRARSPTPKPPACATSKRRSAPYWRGRGDVAEAFGHAWSKAGGFEEAIDWYERAREAQDGTASLAAIEQLANAKMRLPGIASRRHERRDRVQRAHAPTSRGA